MKQIILKQTAYLLFACAITHLAACQSSPRKQAQKTSDAIQNVMKSYGPGKVTTSDNGYIMKAVIDGKNWEAKSMMEINPSNTEFIHGSESEIKIGFYIDRDHIKIGKSRKLGLGHSADLDLGSDKLMSAKSGEYVITKADDKMIEGSFHFIASPFQSDETKEVANGFFRILLK